MTERAKERGETERESERSRSMGCLYTLEPPRRAKHPASQRAPWCTDECWRTGRRRRRRRWMKSLLPRKNSASDMEGKKSGVNCRTFPYHACSQADTVHAAIFILKNRGAAIEATLFGRGRRERDCEANRFVKRTLNNWPICAQENERTNQRTDGRTNGTAEGRKARERGARKAAAVSGGVERPSRPSIITRLMASSSQNGGGGNGIMRGERERGEERSQGSQSCLQVYG